MPIDVNPSMLLPVNVLEPTGPQNGAMIVTFAVPVRNWQVNLSLSLCIRVTIGGVTISIYYNKTIFAAGQSERFEAILPVDSTIQSTKATYVLAYLDTP